MNHYKDISIEYRDVDSLIPYARNPRKNDEAAKKLASVIAEFGFQVPVIIRGSGDVIDGHARLKAAKILGMQRVPVIVNDEWTEAQAKAFRLSVNKSAEWAEWDDELLNLELDDLKLEDFDLELIGFEDIALGEGTEGLTDPDDVPDVQEQPVSKQGDIWLLGKHRLMCGDSTDAGSVALLMAGEKAGLCLTDPPYGVNIVKGSAAAIGGAKPFGKGTGRGVVSGATPREVKFGTTTNKHAKAMIGATVYPAIIGDESTETAQKSYDIAKGVSDIQVIFGGNYFTDFLPASRCWYVWDKGQPDGTPFAQVELAWVSKDGNARIFHRLWSGLCREGDRKTEGAKRIHPTQKPVSLCCDIISEFECDSVLDLFGGSGSTLIACEQTNRQCRMMELSEHYCDVIIRRWQDFTGRQAVLDGDGRTFAEVEAERG